MTDQLVLNRHKFETDRDALWKSAADDVDGAYRLNLGCAGIRKPGFINVDKYVPYSNVWRCDMYKLPFKDGTIDLIYSSHSIEHLPIRQAEYALHDWYRILKPGGILFLALPDLGIIMQTLLLPNLSREARRWFMYCLFGFQADMETPQNAVDPPVDPGQFHSSGFSISTLLPELQGIGYKVLEAYNYEGYGTPGLFVRATK